MPESSVFFVHVVWLEIFPYGRFVNRPPPVVVSISLIYPPMMTRRGHGLRNVAGPMVWFIAMIAAQ